MGQRGGAQLGQSGTRGHSWLAFTCAVTALNCLSSFVRTAPAGSAVIVLETGETCGGAAAAWAAAGKSSARQATASGMRLDMARQPSPTPLPLS